jgi:hypothetical protein
VGIETQEIRKETARLADNIIQIGNVKPVFEKSKLTLIYCRIVRSKGIPEKFHVKL